MAQSLEEAAAATAEVASSPTPDAPSQAPAPGRPGAAELFAQLKKQSSAVLERTKSSISSLTAKRAVQGDAEAPQQPQGASTVLDTIRRQTSTVLQKAESVPGVPVVKQHWNTDAGRVLKLGLFGFEVRDGRNIDHISILGGPALKTPRG